MLFLKKYNISQLTKEALQMGHKCYISFKTEDSDYKTEIQNMGIDMVDKSLNEAIDSDNEDYIMRKIRDDYFLDWVL